MPTTDARAKCLFVHGQLIMKVKYCRTVLFARKCHLEKKDRGSKRKSGGNFEIFEFRCLLSVWAERVGAGHFKYDFVEFFDAGLWGSCHAHCFVYF